MNKILNSTFRYSCWQTGLAWAMRATILCISILGCLSSARVWAQDARPIIEIVPTFLEQELEGREPALDVLWTWNKVEGQRHAYEIVIDSPSSWKAAYLCIDGKLAKILPPATLRFDWSFKSLPAGKHTASLLIKDENGNIGVASRPIRIR